MSFVLEQTYEAVKRLDRTATAQEICDTLTALTGRYGVTCMLAGALPTGGACLRDEDLLVSAYPGAWMGRYIEQDYARTDPIIHRLLCDPAPFLWSADTADSPESVRMFGEAAEFGVKAGIATPVVTVDGGVVGVSLSGEKIEIPPCEFGLISTLAAFSVARAIALRNRREEQFPGMTPREIECLKWAADGKTEWEISSILGISEHTAGKHFANAQKKLGAANRAHAVALAIRWGFIS